MKVLAITVALFCALYALFWALASPTPQPTHKTRPQPQIQRTWT